MKAALKLLFKFLHTINIFYSKYTSEFIFIIYFIFVNKLIKESYRINDFSYMLSFCLLISCYITFKLLTGKLKLKKQDMICLSAILLVLLLIGIHEHKYILSLIERYYINNLRLINNAVVKSSIILFDEFFPFMIILVPAFSLPMFLLDRRKLVTATTVIMSLPLILLWYTGFEIEMKPFLPIFVFIIGIYYTNGIYYLTVKKLSEKNAEAKINRDRILIYSSSLVISLSLLCVLAVKYTGVRSIKQIKYDYIKRTLNIGRMAARDGYNLSISGYGEDGSLGGPVLLSNNVVLRVESDDKYYLRGNIKDYYDGTRWKSTDEMSRILDKSAYIKNIMDNTGYINGYDLKKIVIYPEGIATTTLFTPLNTFHFKAENDIVYNSADVFVFLDKDDHETKPYTVEFYNASSKEDALKIQYDISIEQENNVQNYKEIKSNYGRYLQIPDNITEKTRELFESVTKDCTGLNEKSAAIQKYLKENYKYSLNVSKPPDNREFIDYFLFTEKKGYCTYFATTAAVFFRMAGIPSRYVEGFYMDDKKDAKGRYIVTGDRAHAWTEVLISAEPEIWCTIDCTPQSNDESAHSYTGKLYDNIDPAYNINEVESPGSDVKNDKAVIKTFFLKFLGYALLFFFIAVTLYFTNKYVRHNKNVSNMVFCDSIIPLYLYAKKRLGTLGIDMRASLCDSEIAENIENISLRKLFLRISGVYYEEYYGELVDLSFNKISYYKDFENTLKKEQGYMKYYLKRACIW